MMNILIIGNGFDLAHNLPTRYTDFLCISKLFIDRFEIEGEKCDYYNVLCSKLIQEINEQGLDDEFESLLINNIWFDFLSERFESGRLFGVNWIDFENEIRQVICHLEQAINQNDGTFILKFNTAFKNENDFFTLFKKVKFKLQDYVNVVGTMNIITYQEFLAISEFLYQELRNLTRAFEIYCVCLINKLNDDFYNKNDMIKLDKQIQELKIEIQKHNVDLNWIEIQEKNSLDKQNIKAKIKREENKRTCELQIKKISEKLMKLQDQFIEWRLLREVHIDCLLSFNYTNTFSCLYGTPDINYCYLHGVAHYESDNTNMVLGIDETLTPVEANINFIFSKFKKYFQRIFYKTGAEYRDWIKELKDTANIYIIGHSLGATDHEILREFFDLTDKKIDGKPLARISVFYYDEESKINAIERTIEIIGKDKLIAKVHGNDWTIRFVNQTDAHDGLILSNAADITTRSLTEEIV